MPGKEIDKGLLTRAEAANYERLIHAVGQVLFATQAHAPLSRHSRALR